MSKTKLIIAREFKTRIKNKAFILMTFLGPLLLTAIIVIPMWIQKMNSQEIKNVAIIDETHILHQTIKDFGTYKFTHVQDSSLEAFREKFPESGYNAVLFIPRNIFASNNAIIYSDVLVDDALKAYLSYVLRRDLEYMALLKEDVSPQLINRVRTPVFIGVQRWNSEGEYVDEEQTILSKGKLSMLASTTIYLFIFIFGVLVLRGVLEEKSNRIVEVIISSVKPLQLMFGKIVGIGLIGLIQFVCWVTFTILLVYGAQVYLFAETFNTVNLPEMGTTLGTAVNNNMTVIPQNEQTIDYAIDLFKSLQGINWPVMIFTFVLFFLLGFILYASIFASIGAIIDQETDSQQFILPVSIPLIFSMIMLQPVIANPNGSLAYWLSVFPLTSPIIMMARLPFGVPFADVLVSVFVMLITCVLFAWISAKLYKTGILHYGKKMSLKSIISVFRKESSN